MDRIARVERDGGLVGVPSRPTTVHLVDDQGRPECGRRVDQTRAVEGRAAAAEGAVCDDCKAARAAADGGQVVGAATGGVTSVLGGHVVLDRESGSINLSPAAVVAAAGLVGLGGALIGATWVGGGRP